MRGLLLLAAICCLRLNFVYFDSRRRICLYTRFNLRSAWHGSDYFRPGGSCSLLQGHCLGNYKPCRQAYHKQNNPIDPAMPGRIITNLIRIIIIHNRSFPPSFPTSPKSELRDFWAWMPWVISFLQSDRAVFKYSEEGLE